MKFKSNAIRIQYDSNMKPEIVIATKENVQAEVEALKGIVAKGKELSVEIKQYRVKRSLDSNAYLWVLLQEMATKLHTTKDELYLEVLSRYGVFTHVVAKPEAVEKMKQQWRTVRELGEVTINGKTGQQLQLYFGSSTYNQSEMCHLLDGVVQECKDLGIETMPPEQINSMMEGWENNNGR